jgi:RHS repeat-associated protein
VSVPVTNVAAKTSTLPQLPARPPTAVTWPAAGSSVVDVSGQTPGVALRDGQDHPGQLARVGFQPAANTPVSVGPVSAVAVAGGATALATPTSPPASVRVEVFGQDASSAAGITGVMLRLSRADGVGAVSAASVKVDYSGFAAAVGADFGGRLELVALPPCALTTPDVPSCQARTELASVNDESAHTVAAQVSLPPDPAADAAPSRSGMAALDEPTGTLVAVTASVSSSSASFGKTSFSESSHWQAGASGGGFDWDYPIKVPPSPSGLDPQVALSYSSASIDGRTNATNGQGSWVGEGFDYQPGYIERAYRACADDTTDVPSPTYTNATGDLCWRDDNATLVWHGHSTELIRNSSDGVWRPADDDGTRVEKLTGAPNGDNDGEYWRLTTTDGTRLYFGKMTMPGWTSGQRATYSVDNVPVFANKSNEPCYSGNGFAWSWCLQAWRWNLDYVVDNSGNTMSYYYVRNQNNTGLTGNPATTAQYDMGGWVDHIEYGTTYGHELDNTTPPFQVVFGVSDRCTTGSCGTHDGTNWPDTPWDLSCAPGNCSSNISPSFWITERLNTITTEYWTGSAYQTVNSWSLSPQWQYEGYLLLGSITHTGNVGGTLTLPATAFGYQSLYNRTDWTPSNGISAAPHARVTVIQDEFGRETDITYEGSDCSATNIPSDPSNNTMRCFPQWWKPPTQPAGWGWWNKWRVSQVVDRDLVGGSPDLVHAYSYSTAGSSTPVLWHHSAAAAVWSTPGSHRSWADFRGWPTVTVTTGASGQTQSATVTEYFRGLNGDDTANTEANRTATITDGWGDPAYNDDAWLAGRILQQTTYDGPAGHELTSTVYDPWAFQTGVRTEDPNHAYPSHSYSDHTGNSRARTRTWIPSTSTWRTTQTDYTHENTYGLITYVGEHGDLSITTDNRCTYVTYAQNTSGSTVDGATARLVDYPAVVKLTDCSSNPPEQQTLRWQQIYYDSTTTVGAPPTRGLSTKTVTAASFSGSTPNFAQVSRASYDSLGRILDSFDALDRKTSTAYTPATGGPLTSFTVTDPAGNVATTTVNPAWGKPLTVSDINNKVTTASYDPLGKLTNLWLPNRSTSQTPNLARAYTAGGVSAPSSITTRTLGPTGAQVTSYEIFDGLLRLRQTQTPPPDANGGRMVDDTQYDSRGQVVKTSRFWNSTGGPSSTLVSFNDTDVANQHRYTYDGSERLTADQLWSSNALKWQTATAYDGTSVTTTPPAGGTATTTFINVFGNVTTARQFLGATPAGTHQDTTYSYDRLQQLTGTADPAGNQWAWTYDLRGRVTSSVDPDRGTTTNTYDDAAELTGTTDALGTLRSFSYDNLGRQTAEWQGAVGTGTKLTDFTYDTIVKGQLTSANRYSGSATYTTAVTGYNDLYQPTGVSTSLPAAEGTLAGTYATSASYNVDGSTATIGVPAAGDLGAETESVGYDSVGNALTLTGTAAYVSGTSYYPFGPVYQRLLGASGSRARLTTAVDEATGRLATNAVATEHPGTPGSFDEQRTDVYTYTPAGTITGLAETRAGATVSNQCFNYDGLQRLIDAWTTTATTCQATPSQGVVDGPDAYWSTWTYDSVGDRTGQTQHAAGGDTTTTYTYPAAGGAHPHFLTGTSTTGTGGPNSASYGDDAVGNTTSRALPGTTQSLVYDAEGHLTSHVINSQTTTYVYDAFGNRLLRKDPDGTVTAFLPDQDLKKAPNGSLTATRYYADVATRSATGLTWTATDHNGTAQMAIDAATLSVTTRRFTPFGEVRTPALNWPNPNGYVNGTGDPTGLTHLGAREYDPSTGRFLTTDPLLDLARPQQWNPYAYASNNPVTKADATGLEDEFESDGEGGLGFGGSEVTGGGTDGAGGDPGELFDGLFGTKVEGAVSAVLDEDAAAAETAAERNFQGQAEKVQNDEKLFDGETKTQPTPSETGTPAPDSGPGSRGGASTSTSGRPSGPTGEPGTETGPAPSPRGGASTTNPTKMGGSYETKVTGPRQTVRGGGEEAQADGVEGSYLADAKYSGGTRSPYISGSGVPDFIEKEVLLQESDQFRRYAAVIDDPTTPYSGLRVIVSSDALVPYFEDLMDTYGVRGYIIVAPPS